MKLSYCIFYTKDIETISRYYNKIIGLDFAFGDEEFVTFKLGESYLGLKKSTQEREVPGFQTAIVAVEDVDEWYARLKERGAIVYKEISDDVRGRSFSVLDPDGNKVEFVALSAITKSAH